MTRALRQSHWIEAERGVLDETRHNASVLRGYALADTDACSKSGEDIEVNLLGRLHIARPPLPMLKARKQLRSPKGGIVIART
jgi:hypothetical protein